MFASASAEVCDTAAQPCTRALALRLRRGRARADAVSLDQLPARGHSTHGACRRSRFHDTGTATRFAATARPHAGQHKSSDGALISGGWGCAKRSCRGGGGQITAHARGRVRATAWGGRPACATGMGQQGGKNCLAKNCLGARSSSSVSLMPRCTRCHSFCSKTCRSKA